MKNKLITRGYEINTGGRVKFRAVLITDIHEIAPKALLSRIRECIPHIIFIGGDLIEAKTMSSAAEYMSRGNKNAYHFLSRSAEIAPVIYGLGNHEACLNEVQRVKIKETGAILLENSAITMGVNGFTVSVGAVAPKPDLAWLDKFAESENYKILLCHRPEQYPESFPFINCDIVLSGHAHGGQWRFFGRGVYAPGQGIFPRYTRGIYKVNKNGDGLLLVSAGASNNEPVPRINNPCEIVKIDFS